MSLVRVKTKYQVTLPTELRLQAGLHVGDFLEAQIKAGKIILSPKSLVDRDIAEGLEDINGGRFLGPFKNVKSAIKTLHKTR